MKGGIFLDIDNLSRNGGYGFDYYTLRKFVESQGVQVIRANAYMAIDEEAETDPEVKKRREGYRHVARKAGFKLTLKKVRKYTREDGSVLVKGDSDLDMAIDALLQSENLDYILLGTGDGDFTRLVTALQSKGKRVDVLSFDNSSGELRRTADYAHDGYQVEGLLPSEGTIGRLDGVNRERGFGFVNLPDKSVFVHISEVTENGEKVTNDRFFEMSGEMIEFDVEEKDGKYLAKNVTRFSE